MSIEDKIEQDEGRIDILDVYVEPTSLDPKDEERLLKEGLVTNIRPIESLSQVVSSHADQVLVGDVDKHADILFEAEVVLPDGKKLLSVWKPDSGANKGTDAVQNPDKKAVPIPENSSPNSHKEEAAWILAQYLGLAHITMPAVVRTINGEEGSMRPYIYGKPVDLLDMDQQDLAFSDDATNEDIAFYDYLLQTMDRRDANLVWEKEVKNKRQLKVIDHSLTYLPEYFTQDYEMKGPRLMVAYDNTKNPPRLKKIPLPDRHIQGLQNVIDNKEEIEARFSALLNDEEISHVFARIAKANETKTFL